MMNISKIHQSATMLQYIHKEKTEELDQLIDIPCVEDIENGRAYSMPSSQVETIRSFYLFTR